MSEQEIKDLQAQLAAKTKEADDAKKAIETAKQEADAAKKEVESAKKLNDTLKQTIVDQEKESTVTATTSSLLPAEVVKVDGKKYKIVFPFVFYNGKKYSAHQVAKDAELQKKLVGQGSGALVEA